MLLKRSADTIVALSSGLPPCGVAIVRISGPHAHAIAEAFGAGDLAARRASVRTLSSPITAERLDQALCLSFPAPSSATGEDVVELHLHGGPALITRVLSDAVALGARVADPGEFTLRAVLNGRMALADAEAMAELIDARSEAERRRASRLAGGTLMRRAADWRSRLIGAMALVEAHLDFADEGDVGADAPAVDGAIRALHEEVVETLAGSRGAERLTDGYVIALVGSPNAGKSSLLNALVEREMALVSPEAGTTRDAIEATLELDGYRVTLVDTAGVREAATGIEAMGIDRTRRAMGSADLVLEVASPDTPRLVPGDRVDAIIAHKCDLADDGWCPEALARTSVHASATIAGLSEKLGERVRTGLSGAEAAVLTRERQRSAAAAIRFALSEALQQDALELKAQALRDGAVAIGRLTGEVGIEEVLDDVFGRFCIGK